MKRSIVVLFGLMLLTGVCYGQNKASATGSIKKCCCKAAQASCKSADRAKRYLKYAENYEKRAAHLEAKGEKAAAAALRKKAEAKRMMSKAFATGDQDLLAKGRAAYKAAGKEYRQTDYAKAERARRKAKKAACKAKKAACKACQSGSK